MVDNIARSGSERFEAYAEKIDANAQAYKARLSALKEELSVQLAPVQGKQTVVFHEAFTYFAHAHGLEVLAVINHENENGLSPAQLSIIIHYVEEAGDPPLFAEDISPTSAAYTVSVETGAKTHAFDPITTGDHVLTAYEDKMRENAKVVLSAFE